METKERRIEIEKRLKENEGYIKGSDLAKEFGVSRQVIVQDIAILRAHGINVVATPQGYYVMKDEVPKGIRKVIVSRHQGTEAIEDELNMIVDMGAKVIDVLVEHPVYGEIRGLIGVESRKEVKKFIEKIKESSSLPLSVMTEGIHLHTIEVKSEADFEELENELFKKGYLIRDR